MEDDVMKELDLVVLTEDLSKHGLKKGDVGTVVLTHREAGYEIEFATLGGETVAVVTVAASSVRPVGRDEIAHARPVGS